MLKITTAQTVSLLRAISAVEFRPMTPNDFAAFNGAMPGSMIGFEGPALAAPLCDITGESILTEGGDAVAVLISGSRVEVYACTPEGEPVSVWLDIGGGLM